MRDISFDGIDSIYHEQQVHHLVPSLQDNDNNLLEWLYEPTHTRARAWLLTYAMVKHQTSIPSFSNVSDYHTETFHDHLYPYHTRKS